MCAHMKWSKNGTSAVHGGSQGPGSAFRRVYEVLIGARTRQVLAQLRPIVNQDTAMDRYPCSN